MLFSSAIRAEDRIDIELNKLEDNEGSCRAYLVFKNHTDAVFNEFKLDLVMFGSDGIISRRLAVDSSPLRSNKTTVKLFDIEGANCGDIGLVLINDVLSCRDTYERSDCINLIETSTKSVTSFVK
jgi:hypothetical protein